MPPAVLLPQSFFDRPPVEVAPDLIGCTVLFQGAGGRIVETEAYAPDDPSSHAYRGMTARNSVMFGPPGHLYVYFVYGMHFCANISCQEKGIGAAVLLRALEPTTGIDEMIARRGTTDLRLLCGGPARLAQALGITREANGAPVAATAASASGHVLSAQVLARRVDMPSPFVAAAPRVGVHDDGRPWRFLEADSPFVSRPVARSGRGTVARVE
jgi:DNA-3-methyladenine glycosylase